MLSIFVGIKPSHGAGAAAPPAATVTLTAFSRDRTLFDSGVGFGRAVADVPLKGTGTAGAIVQARAVSLDDGGATTTAWVDVATIAAGGSWAGNITVPRSSSWFRPEVRIKTQPAVTATVASRFGVGHVIAIWGQSEVAYILNAFYSSGAVPTVADPEAVQVISGADTTPAVQFITNAAPMTAAVAAMAATFITLRPGEKFALVFQTVPGTDPRQLVNDSDPGRDWFKDKALHDFVTADGQSVGLAAMSWFASPGSLGSDYGDALFPLFAGKRLTGTAVTFPTDITYGAAQSYHADHWFGELYTYTKTKWIGYGPHRFDIGADMLDATHLIGGAIEANLTKKQQARASWRAMLTSSFATMFLPLGPEPINYVNGRDDGAGSWTDFTHPSGVTPDGMPAFARLTALAVLKAAGMTSLASPEFDNCQWEPTGAYVEVWSSAGPVTTTRLARAEAALGTTFPHWTTVMGFQINGQPAQNAQIVAGRVRIFRNGGGSFIFSDTITYGEGGATGQIQFPEDMQNATWKNLPIVNVGAPGLDGLAVRPMPQTAVLANTLPANPKFTTVAGQLTSFRDLVNWPTTGGKITVNIDAQLTATGATVYLMEMDNGHISFDVTTAGLLRMLLKDSANTTLMSSVTIANVAFGVRFNITAAVDLAANTCWTTFNGVTTTRTFAANSGVLASASRKFRFLARGSNVNHAIGDFFKLEVWTDAVAGGGVPPTDTLLRANGRVIGPAVAANAHPWKLGGNVV